MKCGLIYAAIAAGGLGLICFALTFFVLPLCYVALGLFILSEVLFIICIINGACCCFKNKDAVKE